MGHRANQGGRNSVSLAFVLLMAGLVFPMIGGSALFAQAVKPDAPKAPANEAKANPAGERPAAEVLVPDRPAVEEPMADQMVPEQPAAEKRGDAKKLAEINPKQDESALVWLYKSMGLRYVIIFLIVSFNEMALVVMIVLGLRRCNICPLDLAAEFDAHLKKKEYQEAYDLAKKDDSFLGKVLASGMANLSDGYDAALEAMQETGEEQTMRLEQRNANIALIAQIGPMLGLLATVDGIVQAFAVIATKQVTPKPSELAGGIGIALVNTVVGLWIAIPSIVFYHFIRNRLTRLVFEAGLLTGRLMKRFANVSASVKKS